VEGVVENEGEIRDDDDEEEKEEREWTLQYLYRLENRTYPRQCTSSIISTKQRGRQDSKQHHLESKIKKDRSYNSTRRMRCQSFTLTCRPTYIVQNKVNARLSDQFLTSRP
jgi:hypothetical protein